MALEGGEARVECRDERLLDAAVGKEADQVLRPLLVQLAGDEVILAGKHPLEQRLSALATRIILHASVTVQEWCHPYATMDLRSRLAGVAQLVEQLIRNQQVVGSSPTAGSIFLRNSDDVRCALWSRLRPDTLNDTLKKSSALATIFPSITTPSWRGLHERRETETTSGWIGADAVACNDPYYSSQRPPGPGAVALFSGKRPPIPSSEAAGHLWKSANRCGRSNRETVCSDSNERQLKATRVYRWPATGVETWNFDEIQGQQIEPATVGSCLSDRSRKQRCRWLQPEQRQPSPQRRKPRIRTIAAVRDESPQQESSRRSRSSRGVVSEAARRTPGRRRDGHRSNVPGTRPTRLLRPTVGGAALPMQVRDAVRSDSHSSGTNRPCAVQRATERRRMIQRVARFVVGHSDGLARFPDALPSGFIGGLGDLGYRDSAESFVEVLEAVQWDHDRR
jgi:hypothetical protein